MMLIGSTLTQFGIVFLFATLMGIHVGKKTSTNITKPRESNDV